MSKKLDDIQRQITKTKREIENLTLSAIGGLKSGEYHFASNKVTRILEEEERLENLKQDYENELSEIENR